MCPFYDERKFLCLKKSDTSACVKTENNMSHLHFTFSVEVHKISKKMLVVVTIHCDFLLNTIVSTFRLLYAVQLICLNISQSH